VREPAPFVTRWRSRTVANGDSMTVLVRRCFHVRPGSRRTSAARRSAAARRACSPPFRGARTPSATPSSRRRTRHPRRAKPDTLSYLEGGIRSSCPPAICPVRLPARRPSVTEVDSQHLLTAAGEPRGEGRPACLVEGGPVRGHDRVVATDGVGVGSTVPCGPSRTTSPATGTSYLELGEYPRGGRPSTDPVHENRGHSTPALSLYTLNVQNILNTH
jgi:hypothetical protein